MSHETNLERKVGTYVVTCSGCDWVTTSGVRKRALELGRRHAEGEPIIKTTKERKPFEPKPRAVPASVMREPQEAPLPQKLHGHAFERINVCAKCTGELRDRTGTYATRYDAKAGSVSPICNDCARVQ